MRNRRTRPFLKWAGGKFRVLDRLLPHLQGRKLIEPFVGSGAVFLNVPFDKYLLGDINPDLINLYISIKKERKNFIEFSQSFFVPENNSKEKYLLFREEFNNGADGLQRAALFVYLNRHGFNGLCRYNQSGGFNVPFGQHVKPYFPEIEMLNFIGQAKNATFVCGDFVSLMNRARKGHVVYCDPPYVPLSATSNFTNYATQGFSHDQQAELARRAISLANRGVKVVISNHDNEITRQIYQDAKIESFSVQRNISRDGANRNVAKELLAIFE